MFKYKYKLLEHVTNVFFKFSSKICALAKDNVSSTLIGFVINDKNFNVV